MTPSSPIQYTFALTFHLTLLHPCCLMFVYTLLTLETIWHYHHGNSRYRLMCKVYLPRSEIYTRSKMAVVRSARYIRKRPFMCKDKKGLQKELKVMTPFRTSALKALKRYWSQECRFEGLSSYKGNAMKGIIAPRWFLRWGLRGTSSCLSVQLSPPCTKSRESKTPL